MGYFADVPKTIKDTRNSLFWEMAQRTQRVRDIFEGLNPIPKENRLTPPITLTIDKCNITVTYDPPQNFFFKDAYHLPGFSYTYRNPACQPPPLPTQPPGDGFYVGGKCNCSIEVTFAFHQPVYGLTVGSKPTSIGGGGALEDWLKGGGTEGLLLESISGGASSLGNGKDGSQFFEQYDKSNVIKTRAGGLLDSTGNSYLSYDIVYWRVMTFSLEEVQNGNGYVDPFFPRFIHRYFVSEYEPFAEEIINAPWTVIHIRCIGCEPNIYIDPPPPPKKKDCECMCCDKNPNDDALLRLILKRIGNLPANVPDNFTKQNPSYINIESLAELALWQMQQLDALTGAYPIKIEVEDTDLTKEGNQTQKIELPNQAEVLAELIGMMITIKRDTHATLVATIKAMGEAGMAKNLATQTLDVALGNAEFLGYKLEQVKRKIPSLFTPGGSNLTETLKEKEIEIVSYENNDNKDLQDDLKYLKTMAARWNAQNWRQVAGDPVESLKQVLFGNPDAIQEVHKDNEQGDFNDFTEQCERGFIEVSGITDSTNPWGRPYDQRPKIREIGTEKGNYKNDGTAKVE